MPRNGSGVYSLPGTYEAVTGETIEAQQHNDPLEDFEADANAVRPVVAGGTGADNAADARTELVVPGLGDNNAFTGTNSFAGVNTYTKIQKWAKGADVASANALTLGDDGNYFDITGTTAITSIGTKGAGTVVRLHFDAALTLTNHATDLILPGGTNITTAAGDEAEFVEYATGDWRCVSYQLASRTPGTNPYPRGYIDGCILSNGTDATNDINIAAGVCRDSTDTVNMTVPALSGKQLDANWAAGGSAGMRNSAAGIADGTYHIWAARTATSATADIYAHTSTTAATVLAALQAESGGSSYAYLRRIGSIIRSAGGILAFKQNADEFLLVTPILDINVSAPGTSAVTRGLTVPSGLTVNAIINSMAIPVSSGNFSVYLSSLDVSDLAPSASASPLATYRASGSSAASIRTNIKTNTSGQIRSRQDASGASDEFKIATLGWIDAREKQ